MHWMKTNWATNAELGANLSRLDKTIAIAILKEAHLSRLEKTTAPAIHQLHWLRVTEPHLTIHQHHWLRVTEHLAIHQFHWLRVTVLALDDGESVA